MVVRFYVMETLKDKYRGGDSSVYIPKYIVGLMGGFAGACSVLGNTPLDVVKTRMQSLDAKRYKNTFDCAKYDHVDVPDNFNILIFAGKS